MQNLAIAVQKLGPAVEEKGIPKTKLALLEEARVALQTSLAEDDLEPAAMVLTESALTHTTFALDCANNRMSGSGVPARTSQNEKKLNEPLHTKKAFEAAFAALEIELAAPSDSQGE
jgi:hypothetical protein